ncbi:unnamed protein product [Cuscuta epithymum]|uniref:Uncharacterized protein n=1 Tax=Cuscuta epithymum TaxID=186058 RepID=A0AAV0C7S0_9ASTE|nr:unnamed protein product [Cuscuta epithymum]
MEFWGEGIEYVWKIKTTSSLSPIPYRVSINTRSSITGKAIFTPPVSSTRSGIERHPIGYTCDLTPKHTPKHFIFSKHPYQPRPLLPKTPFFLPSLYHISIISPPKHPQPTKKQNHLTPQTTKAEIGH